MKKSINVAVLGSDGLLASDLVEMLQYESSTVRGYTKDLYDVTKKKSQYNLIGEVTHIFNCSAVKDCQDLEKAAAVNDNAVKDLAELCLENEIHLTHFSTAEVFDGAKGVPYSENDVTSPLSTYGKTKLAGESHVLAMGDKGLVIRSNWLFGKYRDNLVNFIMREIEVNNEVILENDEIGNPTYSMDLSNAAIILALNNKSGLYNVTNSGSCSKYELGLKIAEYLNVDKNLIKAKKFDSLERPKYSLLSPDRLEKTVPDKLRSWEKALYQYLLEIGKVQ
jgi:dTDP-4-dehydrorhamnose reductase